MNKRAEMEACYGTPLKLTMNRNGYFLHHTAYARGYESRTSGVYRDEPYKGRYGEGIIIHYPAWNTTRYHKIAY